MLQLSLVAQVAEAKAVYNSHSINNTTEHYLPTVADVLPTSTHTTVFVDNSLPDGGILQEAVTNTSESESFHLFSHGRPGELLIEGQWLGAEEIANWLSAQHLPKNIKQLSIYGCNFAQGEVGLAAVAYIEKELGITVSASTNITGSDGDWILEAGASTVLEGLEAYAYNLQVCGVDIHIANDNSGSVDAEENRQSRAFASQLGVAFAPLGSSNTQSRIGISTWASGNNFVEYSFPGAGQNFTTSLSDVLSYANSARTLSGGTDVYKALLFARDKINKTPVSGRAVPKVIVLMTDAFCNQIARNITDLATQLKQQGIYIVVMAIDAASTCPVLRDTTPNGVASPGGYFAAGDYNLLYNGAINYINNIRSTTCSVINPPPYDLAVSLSNFQITNCTPGPATASVNYTVTNISTGTPFNNNLRVSFYDGNPTLPTTNYLFTTNAGTQNIPVNGGSYTSSVTNAALLNTSTLYAVVNYDGATAGNAPPLSYSTLLSKLAVSGEGAAGNNISGAAIRTDGPGCVPFAIIDVSVLFDGQICDNQAIYTVKVCNKGNADFEISTTPDPVTGIGGIYAYPPAAYSFVSANLIGADPYVGGKLPQGACATYAYTYNLNAATPGTAYNFSVDVKEKKPEVPNICNPSNPTAIVDVVSATGKTWMDRNLGATRAATSSTDAQSYGHLYQWGRASDGHQCVNRYAGDGVTTSSNTSTNATTAVPNGGNAWDGRFILETNSPYDWLTPQNVNLWQGVNGTNNPCPAGYRIPTEAELQALDNSFTPNNSAGAFTSLLKMPLPGGRLYSDGSLYFVGSYGYYWSSTVSGILVRSLGISSGNSNISTSGRAEGFSVRCIKD